MRLALRAGQWLKFKSHAPPVPKREGRRNRFISIVAQNEGLKRQGKRQGEG